MRSEEFDAFATVIRDLCAAYDRPATDERVRVFWEDLRHLHLLDVKRSAESWRRSSKKMPTPIELKPARPTAPPPKDPIESERWSTWAMAANKILFAIAYQDERRGFKPMGKEALDRCLAAKRDYVEMAEDAERHGQAWDTGEFNRMCREGFEKLLGTTA